jgi:hypothetical protein
MPNYDAMTTDEVYYRFMGSSGREKEKYRAMLKRRIAQHKRKLAQWER